MISRESRPCFGEASYGSQELITPSIGELAAA